MSLFGQSSASPFGGQNSQNNQQKPLFGSVSTSQTQTTPSLFGNPAQPQVGGLFGSSAASSQPQQSGGLFGSTTAASQPQQSGGFGNTTSSQAQQSGGLFGNTATTSQPPSRSLFGSTTPSSQSQPGGLFGSTNQQNNQQNSQQGGGLFGRIQTSQPQQSKSLFGGSTTQTQPSNSLFGGNMQTQQKPSLFGGSTAQPQANSLFSGSARPSGLTMGQSTTQQPQQQTVPAVKIDVSQIRGTTRFNELHEEIQKQIEQIDAFIQQQIGFKEQCDALLPAHEANLSTIPTDVEYISNKLETAELSIENDTSAVSHVKSIVQKDAEDARVSFRAVENLKLPQQFHYSGVWQNLGGQGISPPRMGAAGHEGSETAEMDLLGFFDSSTSSLSGMLSKYESNLTEIENHLNVVEANTSLQAQQVMFKRGREGGSRSKDEQTRELSAVLRGFAGAIDGVAERLETMRADMDRITEGEAAPAIGWR